MNLKWIDAHTIYVTLHGSRAYGLANEFSDVDVKGICIPPPEIEYGLFDRFEQAENYPAIESTLQHLKNPNNPKFESSIYSLRKFFILAAGVNPNIIELLHTSPEQHFIKKPIMEKVLENRNLFLSTKARFTFSGYASAQAKKIERHRKWIVMGELKKPCRADYGLPEISKRGVGEVFDYLKSKVERWNLNQFTMDEMQRSELKDVIWDLLSSVINKEVSVSNWPDVYSDAAFNNMAQDFNFSDEVIAYIQRERKYFKDKQTYESWVKWKTERNPERRALEEKCGYDSKHASQLIRLMKMGMEIISEGKVIVNRQGIDADEILFIKNGGWTFDKVMEFKEEMDNKLEAEYQRHKKLISEGKPTPIPQKVNTTKINELYNSIYSEYWRGWTPDELHDIPI